MAPSQLEVTVRRRQGAAILDLRGEIDGSAQHALAAAYAEAERTDPESILLNFSHARYINSTGIALILGLLTKARASHRRLFAYGLSDYYVEIFAITRLADFILVFTDEASALAEAGQRVSRQRAGN